MMHILKCAACASYGLDEKCSCGGTRSKPKPPKYSQQDKYGDYRRQFKEQKNGAGADDDEEHDDDNINESEEEELE